MKKIVLSFCIFVAHFNTHAINPMRGLRPMPEAAIVALFPPEEQRQNFLIQLQNFQNRSNTAMPPTAAERNHLIATWNNVQGHFPRYEGAQIRIRLALLGIE